MLNISSTTAVSWPTPASTAVAPVSPTVAVQPVQAGGQDGKAQMGFGRDDRGASQAANTHASGQRRPEDGRAPSSPGTVVTVSGAPATAAASAHDPVAKQQARQEAAEAAEKQQAKGKKAVEHLQQVLSNMWEASAAVVDRALGIEPSDAEKLGNQSDTSPDLSAAASALLPRKTPVALRSNTPALEVLARPDLPLLVADGEPLADLDLVGDGVAPESAATQGGEIVSYDENGNGNTATVEAGSIIDQRV